MALIFNTPPRARQNLSSPFGGFGGFGGFQSLNSLSGRPNLNDPDTLLELARLQGGSLAAAAEELVHPQTSLLATMGNKFKSAFSTFVEIISVPSQTVAGLISSDFTVREAIKGNINPSDILFGDKDPDATLLQKVGSFLVRTAVDILSDPLTYVTFGASAGIFGIRAATRITLGEKAIAGASKAGVKVKEFGTFGKADAAVNKQGQELFKYLKKVEQQQKGLLKANVIKTGDELQDFAGRELDDLLKESIDTQLGFDLTKRAMSNLLEKYPQLTGTLLDKGGIKFFGQSIISGHRIRAVNALIPGMTILDNFTRPARQAINALFDTSVVKVDGQYIRLPQEELQLLQNASDLAISMGDVRVRKLVNIVKANKLDVNEAKFLLATVEAGKMPADPRLANAFTKLQGFNKEELQGLRDIGFNVSRLENHVPHIGLQNKVKNALKFKTPPSLKVGAAIHRTLEGTVFSTDISKLNAFEKAVLSKNKDKIDDIIGELKNDGFEIFDDNVVTALTARALDNVKVNVTKQFVRELARNFGKSSDVAPDGWRAINSTAIKKAETGRASVLGFDEAGIPITTEDPVAFLKSIVSKTDQEFVYHPAVAKRVEEFMGNVINDDATNDLLRNYDKLQNLWKASVTSMFPAFHGRNAISNVFLHMMDIGVHSLDPRLHALTVNLGVKSKRTNRLLTRMEGAGDDAVKATEEYAELMDTQVFEDATGYNWKFGELHSVVKQHNIAFTRRITSNIDITREPEEAIDALWGAVTARGKAAKFLPTGQKFIGFKAGRGIGTAIEEQARLVDFVANLRATGDVNLAAQRTKQFLFDYSNLTNFEKTVMRRLIPFYTFTRKNLEVQARALMTTPGRSVAQIHALTNLGEVISGAELTQEERDALPDWIKSGVEILKSKRGETVEILGSLGTPLEQPFQAFQPNNFLGSISPILRVPVEQASGYSFFHGKALSDVTNAAAFQNFPQVIKNFIGYTEIKGKRSDGTDFTWFTSLRPERMHILLNLPPTSRVLTALKQMQAADVSGQSKILQQLVGLRPFSFDLEQEAVKRERELREKLEKLLVNAGVVAKFSRTFIPKD